jgi:hypothetical protein
MTNHQPPTTNVATHFDSFTNEWVTTFTVRHKAAPVGSVVVDPLKDITLLNTNNLKLNPLPSDLKLPTVNQKPLAGIPYY